MQKLLIARWKTPRRAIIETQENEPVLLLEAFPEQEKRPAASKHLFLMKQALAPEHCLCPGPDGKQWLRISMRSYEYLAELPATFLSKALGGWSVELVPVTEQLAA